MCSIAIGIILGSSLYWASLPNTRVLIFRQPLLGRSESMGVVIMAFLGNLCPLALLAPQVLFRVTVVQAPSLGSVSDWTVTGTGRLLVFSLIGGICSLLYWDSLFSPPGIPVATSLSTCPSRSSERASTESFPGEATAGLVKVHMPFNLGASISRLSRPRSGMGESVGRLDSLFALLWLVLGCIS